MGYWMLTGPSEKDSLCYCNVVWWQDQDDDDWIIIRVLEIDSIAAASSANHHCGQVISQMICQCCQTLSSSGTVIEWSRVRSPVHLTHVAKIHCYPLLFCLWPFHSSLFASFASSYISLFSFYPILPVARLPSRSRVTHSTISRFKQTRRQTCSPVIDHQQFSY